MTEFPGNFALARAYSKVEQEAYSAFASTISEEDGKALRLGRRTVWLRRTRILSRFLSEQGIALPEEFLRPYAIPVSERISSGIPLKYQFRGYNILRDLARVAIAAPELLQPDTAPVSVLDPSAGGCGVVEAMRHYGHSVTSRDYFDPEQPLSLGNAYREIHAEIGVDIQNFDGRSRPYGFEDDSFDYVFCFQALDAYAPMSDWSEAVEELLRIASKGVILVFNPSGRDKTGLIGGIYRMLLQLEPRDLDVTSFTCPDTNLPGMKLQYRA
ncbi:methyltransferase domain-containing protein [Ruegeria sp. Ofav3-42]|uniref:methyltransferase domain-containing protein n=1 Tax=Ruegeria sp. Ofav3-42 TaxID=2917759 RepID=UPI001EF504D1|nr:methyltransferase domain-containing protein [Ruegeria sp. Ofav3-42]MCG7521250.1 class I SAM-dependent methyltransferase [Ruegeria sp. Ofav3-42]